MNNTAKLILPALLSIGIATAVADDADSFTDIQRDVEVMSRALQAAAGNKDRTQPHLAKVDGTYLARQGVVFRLFGRGVRSSSGHHSFIDSDFRDFGEDIEIYVDSIVSDVEAGLAHLGESLSEVGESGSLQRFMVVEEFDGDHHHDEMAEQLSEQSRQHSARVRELRRERSNAQRQYREAQRKFEREMEQYEGKLEAGQDSSVAQGILAQAEQGLKTARDKYRKGREAYADKLQVIKEEQEKEQLARIGTLTTNTLASLCRYGTQLRALPGNEHVTLVFDGMGARGDHRQDLYYVLTKKDFDACLTDKISSTELAKRATRYSF